MRALTILRTQLQDGLDFLHAKTNAALWRGVEGVLNGDQLWLTALGRALPGDCADKHRIKAADRLLGNANLQHHLLDSYHALAAHLMAGLPRPCVSVDWTGVGSDHYALTASLCFDGRSLPVFTRVYPCGLQGSPTAEREFLQDLAAVVPTSCKPILITDAGFYLAWADQVSSLGWDFIIRIRGTTKIRVNGVWRTLAELHQMAGRCPRSLGVAAVSQSKERNLRLVLASQRKSKGRKTLTRKGTPRRNTTSVKAANAAREPWVLATSLACSSRKVVRRYARRMQIEECFRDLKAHRHGWSLDYVRCKTPQRIAILFLLASLAVVVMHIIGIAAHAAKLHFAYQANTIRKRRVFSTFFFARLLIRDGQAKRLKTEQLHGAIESFRENIFRGST